LRRPDATWQGAVQAAPELAALGMERDLAVTLEADVKYEGYIARARNEVERQRRQENVEIPSELDFTKIAGLRGEAREKLTRLRPRTLGAASRIAGVNPPDVALVAIHVARARRASVAE
jgi:tRNA uridine 5-carboxymethylaminomethyl modification enzyme